MYIREIASKQKLIKPKPQDSREGDNGQGSDLRLYDNSDFGLDVGNDYLTVQELKQFQMENDELIHTLSNELDEVQKIEGQLQEITALFDTFTTKVILAVLIE